MFDESCVVDKVPIDFHPESWTVRNVDTTL